MAEKSSIPFDNLVILSHIKEIVKNLTDHHLKQMSSSNIDSGSSIITAYEGTILGIPSSL